MRTRAIATVLAVGVVALVIVSTEGGSAHQLRAVYDAAVQVVPGQEVRVAGRKVGSITSVREADGEAILGIGVDDSVWPLHQGTTARLRWGSTSGYSLRYVELVPGPASAPALPDNGLLPKLDTITPVELDQVYRIFRGSGRRDLGALVDELGGTFGARAPALAATLSGGAAGTRQLSALLGQLGADEYAVNTLVTAGDETTSSLAARDGQLGEAVGHAAQTFNALADRAGAIQASLARLPSTLDVATTTLARLDRSTDRLHALVRVLSPGTVALRQLAPVARDAFAELRQVAPLGVSALNSGTAASHPLAQLLRAATPFLPPLGKALGNLAPMVGCVRPYAPELAGFLSSWIGWAKNYDSQGHYARILTEVTPVPIGATSDSQQEVASHGGALSYAMPRPPGLNAGQPWFQPQCGAGPQSLDPALDPEAAR